MLKNYFVSYIYNKDNKTTLSSSTILYTKIKSMDDVKKIEDSLARLKEKYENN